VIGMTRSRTQQTEAAERAGARIIVADASQTGAVDDEVGKVDHVVFAVSGLTPPATAAQPADASMRMLLPLLNVLESIRRRPGASLTYISSGGTVYGNPQRLPVTETDPTEPISPYGALHLACEDFARMYSRGFGIPLLILRCANVYGPDQARHGDQGAVAIFLDRIARGLPLHIFGDGSALRDYVFVDDVAGAAARLIVDRCEPGIVNVGSGRGLTVLEITTAISSVVGRAAIVEFVPDRGFDVHAVVLDIARLQALIPYTPTEFAHGLAATSAAPGTIGIDSP
jgi:UDP-glucose 4-epimerase